MKMKKIDQCLIQNGHMMEEELEPRSIWVGKGMVLRVQRNYYTCQGRQRKANEVNI